MKVVKISQAGRDTHHGIGYTEHDGYGGTSDSRLPVKRALAYEVYRLADGELYQVEINGENTGEVFVKRSVAAS